MKLWIDADAAPRDVKEICYRASDRLKLETVLVANQRVQLPLGYSFLSAVRVEGGPDVADMYIAEHSRAGDVAVTADIPLAALLVPKGVVVIDPRGDVYTEESIGERLSVRNFMDGLRTSGIDTGGHASYGAKEKQAFANAIDRALTRALRRHSLCTFGPSSQSGEHDMAKDESTSRESKDSAEPKKGNPGGSGGKGQSGTDAGKTDSGKDKDKHGSTGSKSSGGSGSSEGSGGGHGGTHG